MTFDPTEARRALDSHRRDMNAACASASAIDLGRHLDAAMKEVARLTDAATMSEGRYEREYGNAALLLNSLRVPLAIDGRHISMVDRVAWLHDKLRAEEERMRLVAGNACCALEANTDKSSRRVMARALREQMAGKP